MLYPSHSDSFSISILQALFLHVPVVAYDIPGLSLYKDFKAVALVREFDINSMAIMAEKFLRTDNELFNDPNLTDFISEHTSWKYVADSHISAIDSIMGARYDSNMNKI